MFENYNNYDNKNNAIDLEPSYNRPQSNGKKVGKTIAFILAVAVIGGASGFGGGYLNNMINPDNDISASVPATTETSVTTETSIPEITTETTTATPLNNSPSTTGALSTKDIVKKVTPSVVLITSEFSNGTATGTGIVLNKDGYIITNAHVIQNEVTSYDGGDSDFGFPFWSFGQGNVKTELQKSSKITITLSDDKEYTAEIVGSDTNSDLAVLKIDANDLTPAEFGDSSKLEMGDTTIAIGFPAGLGLSTSQGIVSGLDRDISFETNSGGTTTMTLIQTDAAINPGNSGGPLVNEYGQVIGINSSKLVDDKLEGLGFAIPITDATPLINELLDNGFIEDKTPKIGITGTDITSATQRYYNLPVESGVMVVSVDEGSCADKAGICEGDIIIKADGKKVETMSDLVKIKNKHNAGDTMTLTLARKDTDETVDIVLDKNVDTTNTNTQSKDE